MRNFIKKRRWYLVSGAIIVIIGGFLVFGPKTPVETELYAIKRGALVQEVSVTGTIKPTQSVLLGFEKSGRVSSKAGIVGKKVETGEVLAKLQSQSEEASVAEAQARLNSANAKLSEYKRGGRAEDIAVKNAELNSAVQDISRYEREAANALMDAYNRSDEAIHKYLDALFKNDDTNTPQLTFNAGNFQMEIDVQNLRIAAGAAVTDLRDLAQNSPKPTEKIITTAKASLGVVGALLGKISAALDKADGLSETTLATYKTDINTARNYNTDSITALEKALQNIISSGLSVEKLRRELDLARAPVSTEAIAQQREVVSEMEAKLKSAEAELRKTFLRSPFHGVVTLADVEVGEIVSLGEAVFGVMTEGVWKIEANVPEADIAKLSAGLQGDLTLDAYGSSEHWTIEIALIDPAEKVIEGVSTYKTTFAIKNPDERIRSGMTANITAKTLQKEAVIIIPSRAIVFEDGVAYVEKMLPDGSKERVRVTTGSRNNNRDIEITEGISEGDRITIPVLK